MKKITLLLILASSLCYGQVKKQQYKDCQVCDSWAFHKGKKQHGQKYCVVYTTIRKYPTGKADTIGWSYSGDTWSGDTYDRYAKLSNRGKYIVDSLKEDDIPHLEQSYLTYEPIYMKPGRKVESFWDIEGLSVVITKYLIFNSKNRRGISLVSENTLK